MRAGGGVVAGEGEVKVGVIWRKGILIVKGCVGLSQSRVVAGCGKLGGEVLLIVGESFISAVGWEYWRKSAVAGQAG